MTWQEQLSMTLAAPGVSPEAQAKLRTAVDDFHAAVDELVTEKTRSYAVYTKVMGRFEEDLRQMVGWLITELR